VPIGGLTRETASERYRFRGGSRWQSIIVSRSSGGFEKFRRFL
jgi:hypothetical protein